MQKDCFALEGFFIWITSLVLRQKTVDILSQFPPDSFRSGDFLHGRFSEPIYGAKFSEKQILAVLTYSRAIVEDAFADAFFHQ